MVFGRISSRAAQRVAVLGVLAAAMPGVTVAQQIAPNPNPSGSTISVGAAGAFNAASNFDNEGTVQVNAGGVLTNSGTLDTNQSGELINGGSLLNDSNLFLVNTANFVNNSSMVNGNSSFGYFFLGNSATATNSVGASIVNTNDASLDIYDTVTFNNQGQLDNYGTLFLLEDIGSPVLNNAGTINNITTGPGVSSLLSNDGTINNSGVIQNQSGSDFDNTGTINILAGGQITNAGAMTNTRYPGTAALINNAGDFILTPTGTIDRSTNTQPFGGFAQSSGTTQIDGTFRTGQFVVAGGTVRGSGTLQSQSAIALGDGAGAAAVLSAGGATDSTLGIIGNLNIASDGIVLVDISSAALFDLIALTGTGIANLGGGLQVQLLGGYTPNLGDTFTFLTAQDINGAFNSLLFPTFAGGTRTFELIFNSPSNPTAASLRTIAVSTIPLPAGIWLLGPAIALLGGLRRRTATDSQA